METDFARLSSRLVNAKDFALLHYTFYVCRCGLLLECNFTTKTCILIPFVNMSYRNTVPYPLTFFGNSSCPQQVSQNLHCLLKSSNQKSKNEMEDDGYLGDPSTWWFNYDVICNVVPKDIWSDRGNKELLDLFTDVMKSSTLTGIRHIVVNKRDSPLVKKDGTLPVPMRASIPLLFSRPMTPPLSFYTGERWMDKAIPPIEAYTSQSYPSISLDIKKPVVLFRGSATHSSRLTVCSMQYSWLDAKITTWNRRDTVNQFGQITFQDIQRYRHAYSGPFMDIREQMEYKYILILPGHQASSRLIWALQSGSVILMPSASTLVTANELWISPLLVPGIHYSLLQDDLSDLEEVYQRLEKDFTRCQTLVDNCKALAAVHLDRAALVRHTQQQLEDCFTT